MHCFVNDILILSGISTLFAQTIQKKKKKKKFRGTASVTDHFPSVSCEFLYLSLQYINMLLKMIQVNSALLFLWFYSFSVNSKPRPQGGSRHVGLRLRLSHKKQKEGGRAGSKTNKYNENSQIGKPPGVQGTRTAIILFIKTKNKKKNT